MLKAKCILNFIILKEVKTSRSVWNSVASRCGSFCLAKGTVDHGADPLVCSPADGKRSAALVRLHRKLNNNREIDDEVEFYACTKSLNCFACISIKLSLTRQTYDFFSSQILFCSLLFGTYLYIS